MHVLSLCSGIGGLERGLKAVVPDAHTVCWVEQDPFCQAILLARMGDGLLDRAPIWDDVWTFDGKPWRGVVDCVTAGFPCQPFSVAGKQRGVEDPRHLWPAIARIIAEAEPALVVLENVPGLLSTRTPDGRRAFQVVGDALHDLGYCLVAGLFTAAEVGAPHKRQRLFVVAHRHGNQRSPDGGRPRSQRPNGRGHAAWDSRARLGHALRAGLEGRPGERRDDGEERAPVERASGDGLDEGRSLPDAERGDAFEQPGWQGGARGAATPESPGGRPPWPPGPTDHVGWATVITRWPDLAPATPQPSLRRVADGPARRMDRLRALGNAVVPQQAALAIAWLLSLDPHTAP